MINKERISSWFNTVLKELSELDNNKGIEMMHSCSTECCKTSLLFKNALDFRNNYNIEEDADKICKLIIHINYNKKIRS